MPRQISTHGRKLFDSSSGANVKTSQNRGDIAFGPEMDKAPTSHITPPLEKIITGPRSKIPRFDTTRGSEVRGKIR